MCPFSPHFTSHGQKAQTNKSTALRLPGTLPFWDEYACVVDVVMKNLIIFQEENFILYYSSHQLACSEKVVKDVVSERNTSF
jgi:hypothetical protein